MGGFGAGELAVQKLELHDASGEPLVSVPSTEVTVGSLDLLGRSLILGKARLQGPRVPPRRGRTGDLNLVSLAAGAASKAEAEPAADREGGQAAAPSRRFTFELRSLELAGGEVE